ncbi:MBG domain-containing protein [Limnohabitans sp. JirII-31]|uniref:MBG domain-containing protein n=1 Tax=Limnohabitans sp. JirII-31 TaxID=1977908 RepID=UPI000C1EDCC1|nr:MBG domain-containing protein [Limnohabitans sp. JirII-31]PIT80853.1 hypothetical protein B9Z41_02820 [Limnohabitans sp. JirII-31]
MNHIYRVIWNASQGVWQAVTEAATARGKSTCVKAAGTAPAVNPQHLNLCIARSVLLFSIACLSAHTQAQTLPTGASIVAGQASISQSGKTMTITQSSDKLATNWQSFNIGQNHTVNFVQPSASSVALNRVTGADVSTIQGALNANGQVFLINPNGVLFTSTAQVSVGGLVASTLSLSDKDFLNGNYQFSNSGSTSAGAVINQGRITVNGDSTGAGGTVALIAARVVNTGNITADKGNVLIGAGNAVTLDLGGPVKIKVSQSSVDALIEQGGAIQADGGLIYLTAQAAGDLVASSIKHTGTSRAQTLTTGEKGQIFLMGSKQTNRIDVGGTLDASAPNGGDGGFVETSAAQVHINDNTKVTTLASGNAASGTWLIDPTDFTVSAGTTGQTSSGIGATTLQNNLANGSVSIATDNVNGIDSGNINVNSDVTWSSTSNLTLSAYNNIYINANIKNTSSGSLNLEYGQGSANGTINGTAASYRVLNGSTVTLSAGNHFSTQLGSNAANKKTYTVITDVASLQNVRNNLSTNYAIGMDINASATSGWNLVSGVYQGFNPIGTSGTNAGYAGNFAGLGHTVSNLTINRPGSSSIGLFGKLESTASVQDIGLTSLNLSANNTAGGLVATNYGAITNSYVIGTLNSLNGTLVAGLVGENFGTINRSYANIALTVTSSGTYYTAGLVGKNNGGTINNSYALGSLTLNAVGNGFGGLVGYNTGVIQRSYANLTLKVVNSGANYGIGGLVGNNTGGTISNSYSLGSLTVNNTGGNAYGGLAGYNQNSASISNSYSEVAVTAPASQPSYGAGLVGLNSAQISNSYSTGSVSGNQAGGLVASNSGAITNSYSISSVTGTGSNGLVVINGGTVTNSYWDTTTSGKSTSAAGTGLTTAQFKSIANYSAWTTTSQTDGSGWVMVDTAGAINSGNNLAGRPILAMEYSNQIRTTNQLQLMALSPTSSYTLSQTINASSMGSPVLLQGGALDLGGYALTTANYKQTSGTLSNGTLTASSGFDLQAGTVSANLTGAAALNKSTSNTVTLSGTSTYTGDTTISDGTLVLSGTGSIAASSGVTTSGSGVLDISGTTSGASVASLSGTSTATTGVVLGSQTLTLSNASGTYAGVIGGTGGLTLTAGLEALSGTNTYTGGTTISGGTLQVGNGTAGSLNATSAVTVASGATLRLNEATGSSFANTVTDNGTVDFAQSGTLTASGVISGAGALTQSGTGTTTLTNTNTYNGTTTISNGTLALSGTGSIAGSSGVTTSGSGVLDISGTTSGASVVSLTGTSTAATGVVLGSQTLTLSNASGTYAGVIAGTGGLTLAAGLEALTGANTYTGDTTINGGKLQLGNNTAGSLSGSSKVMVANGATFLLYQATGANFTNTVIDQGTVTFTPSGTLTASGAISGSGSLIQSGTGTTTLTGANTYSGSTTVNIGTLQVGNGTTGSLNATSAVTVASGATLRLNEATGSSFANTVIDNGTVDFAQSGTLTASGVISGTGALTQSGTGTTTLTNTNTYNGTTTISNGTLALSGTGSIAASSGVTTSGSGVLDISGTTSGATLVSLTGTSTAATGVVLGSQTLTLSNASGNYAGVIGGTGGLTVAAGSETLSGTNTYQGSTSITAGSLIIQNDNPSTASSSFSGSGKLVIESSNSSFANSFDSSSWALGSLGGLRIGKSGNTADLTINRALSMTGDINLFGGNVSINQAITNPNNTLSITAAGNVTQSAALVSNTLVILGANTVTLNNSNNQVNTLAATGVGTFNFLNNGALSIGQSGGVSGVASSAAVNISTRTGDLSVNANITTTDSSTSAVTLNAGKDAIAGTSSGGNLLMANGKTITVGTGGRAVLYTGSVNDSTGLSNLAVSGSGHYRYNSDESETNYSTVLGTGLYAVYREKPTVILSGSQAAIYGDALPTLQATVTGTKNGDSNTDLSMVSPSYSVSSYLNAGQYSITSTNLASLGYAVQNTTFTVNARPITVTGSNASRVYGDSNPTLSYTAESAGTSRGLVAGDSLIGAVSTSATSASSKGSYDITQGSLTNTNNSNYDISYTNGTLTVNARPITVSGNNASRVYGDSNPSLTYTTEAAGTSRGLVAGDSLIGAVSTSATSASSKGSYDITQGSLTNTNNSNYDISYTNGTLTVHARPITVSGVSTNRVYGDSNPSLTYTTEAAGTSRGLVAGDSLIGAVSTNATSASSKGSYDITQGSLTNTNNSNYDISYTNGTLTVNARPITVSGNNASRVYGDSNPSLTYTTEVAGTSRGLVAGDSLGLSGSLVTDATASSSKGSYDIAQGSLSSSNTNYDMSYAKGTLTVNARPITVTANSLSRVYGDSNPSLTYTTEAAGTSRGLVAGDSLGLSGSLVTDATASSSKGSYDIAQGSLSSSNTNYDMSYAKATLTVNARPITVSGVSTSRVYGDSNPSLTYTVQVDQGVANTTSRGLASLDGAFETLSGSVTTAATSASNKGIYDITQGSLTNANNDNYAITYSAGTLTINARPISLVGTRTYDGSTVVKASIFSLSNLVNNEDLVLSGSGSVASPLVAAGTQEVNLGSLALNDSNNGTASNYTLLGGSYLATITGPNVSPAISTASITIAQQIAKVSTASTNAPTLGLPLAPTPASAPAIAVNTATSGGSSVQTSTVSTAVTTNTNDEPTVQASAATPATTVITVSAPLAQPQVQAEVFVGGLLLVRAPANTNLSENNVALLQAGPSNVVRDSGRDANGFMRIKVTSGGIRD